MHADECHGTRRAGGPALAAVIATLILAVSVAVSAQDSPDRTAVFYEPIRVQLVDVDVVVTDRSGTPITDLTADDFEVFEDGTRMEITNFYAIRGADETSGDSRLAEDIHLVLFMDDTNVDPQLRTSVLNHVRQLLGDGLPPNVQAALVRFDGSLHIESDFSDQADVLIEALDRLGEEPAMNPDREGQAIVRRMQSFKANPQQSKPPLQVFTSESDLPKALQDPMEEDPQAYAFIAEIQRYARARYLGHRASLEALRRISTVLGAIPGRTVMLWVGGIEQRTGEALFSTWQGLFPKEAQRRGVNAMAQSMQFDLSREIEDVLEEVNTRRISLFPVGELDGGAGDMAFMNSRIMQAGGVHNFQGAKDSMAQEAAIAVMAAVTGGRPLTDNARLGEQLEQVAAGLTASYSLAYRPPSPDDGEYHEIAVKVRRDDAVARYRTGYRASGSSSDVAERTIAAAVLGTGVDRLGVSATCREQEPRENGTFMVPVEVSVPLGALMLLPEGERHTARISVLSVVRDKRGGMSEVNRREYPIEIDNDRLVSAVEQSATFVLGLVLRKGPQRVAVSVLDENSGVSSTVFVDLDVGGSGGNTTG